MYYIDIIPPMAGRKHFYRPKSPAFIALDHSWPQLGHALSDSRSVTEIEVAGLALRREVVRSHFAKLLETGLAQAVVSKRFGAHWILV